MSFTRKSIERKSENINTLSTLRISARQQKGNMPMESTALRATEAKGEIYRIFSLEGSELKIIFRYNEKFGRYIGDFPDFEQEPLYTDSGKPWVCAVQDMCSHGQCKDGSVKGSFVKGDSKTEVFETVGVETEVFEPIDFETVDFEAVDLEAVGADCGSCMFFIREKDDDMIGVCGCDACRRAY